MLKNKKILKAVLILVFTFSLALSVLLIFRPHGQTVQIIQDGEILYTINLDSSEDRIIEIFYQNRKNTVQIKNHRISIIDAECPDKTCVKTGELKSGAMPIVCLPNKLVIKFAEDSGTDAQAG